MKWVTRARPKVDRIACPWLIKRFVDQDAEFLYVPTDQVNVVAERDGAIPFDAPGVELGHHGAECSFDAILEKYHISDPALHKLALIVRGADTAAKDLTPESRGLEAIATVSAACMTTTSSSWRPSPSCMTPSTPSVSRARGKRSWR